MASSNVLTLYRLVATRWAATALSGEGARLYGGRWNSIGYPLVYLSSSRSLCALESLVHLTSLGSRKKQFSFLEVSIAKSMVQTLSVPLPTDWRLEPPVTSTMQLGDNWLQKGSSLALQVPSAVIPEESNYLLNPLHKDFSQITLSDPLKFRFDERL